MSQDDVFEGSECDIDAVPRVPLGHMLQNNEVPEAPADIPDCPDVDFAPLPTEIPPPPCPSIEIVLAEFEYFDPDDPATEPTIEFTIVQGSCCDFDISLSMRIPSSCPSIEPLDNEIPVEKEIPFVDGPSTLTFIFSFTKEPDCDFTLDVDIDVEVHCPAITPIITVTKAVGYGLGTLAYIFTKDEESCDYDLDIEVDVPCGGMFPLGSMTSIPVEFSESPELLYGFTFGGGCDYSLGIEIGVPCPAFQSVITVQTLEPEDEAEVELEIVEFDLASCGKSFEWIFKLPRGVQGYQGFQGYQGEQGFQGYQGGDACPDMLIVNPISVQTLDAGSDATVGVSLYQPDPLFCDWLWEFTFGIPKGAQGDQGYQGNDGAQGAPGDQGAPGSGAQGDQGFQGFQGDIGAQGAQGDQGFQGDQGDKTAIVPVTVLGVRTHVALYCTENPDARFEDVFVIPAERMPVDIGGFYTAAKKLDPRLIEACEDGSILVIGVVPDWPTQYGAVLVKNEVRITYPAAGGLDVRSFNVTVSGIRRGYSKARFRQHTAEEAEWNRNWWSGWRDPRFRIK